MRTPTSATRTWPASRSASLYTTTVRRPSSRQARMIRTAISPRLATKTVRNGSGAAGASLRKDAATTGVPRLGRVAVLPASPPLGASPSERDVPMLLPWVGVALGHQRLESSNEPCPRLRRTDDIVDVSAA